MQAVSEWQNISRPQEGCAISFEFTHQIRKYNGDRIQTFAIPESGFAICHQQQIYVYRNHCPHVGSPLDWIPNQFFSEDGQSLLCHTHGAQFKPDTGACISGPCPRGLYPLPWQEAPQGDIQVPKKYTSDQSNV